MVTESTSRTDAITPRKLWFGLATSAFAWTTLGILDIVVVWRTCERFGQGTGASGHEAGRALSFALAVVLLIIAVTAGVISYRNWRTLSRARRIIDALATDRREFMALLGVFVSLTLGMGIFWLALAPIFITACQRAR